jgi:excisionase family DNA binding protein
LYNNVVKRRAPAGEGAFPGILQRRETQETKMAVFNKQAAAKYCGISVETLDKFKDQGKLGFTRIGKRVVFRQCELDQFLESLTVPAKTPPSFREQQIAASAARQHLREAVSRGNE